MGGTKRSDDDWMSTEMNVLFSERLAQQLGCLSPSNVSCLQAVDVDTLHAAASRLQFSPALAREGDYPLGLIRRGEYTRVPTIIGGQSCESCKNAQKYLGPFNPSAPPITKAAFDAALIKAGFDGTRLSPAGWNTSGVDPAMLETWYAERIAREGRWRTFARVLSDSGHACSAALHAQALGATSSVVWRYFFEFVQPGSVVPGACHGAQRNWVNAAYKTTTPAEVALEESMVNWWASLGAHGDPNSNDPSAGQARSAAAEWATFARASDEAMFLDARVGLPRMNASADTLRVRKTPRLRRHPFYSYKNASFYRSLPRQARDKHRENPNRDALSAGRVRALEGIPRLVMRRREWYLDT